MTDDVIKFFRSPFRCVVLSAAMVFLARLIQLPLTVETNPSVVWVVSLCLGAVFRSHLVTAGVFIGHITAGFLPVTHSPLVSSPIYRFTLDGITALCIALSLHLIIRKLYLRVSRYLTAMVVSLASLGWLSLHQPDIRIAFVYFAASAITGVLSCVKNASLDEYPSMFFSAWFPGYIVWVMTLWIFGLHPSGTVRHTLFIEEYVLVPFAVYILLILIGSHLVQSIEKQINN
jgi:hypothetical protein